MATAPILNPAASTPTAQPAFDPMAALLEAVRSRRDEFTERQQISADVVGLMKQAGVYRACVAQQLGGDEVSPGTFLKMIERIAQATSCSGPRPRLSWNLRIKAKIKTKLAMIHARNIRIGMSGFMMVLRTD